MDSETLQTAFVLPEDVPPLLQDAIDSLYRIISQASQVRRNTQKVLHFIARCVDIIENLKGSIKEHPSTFEEMMAVIESVRKLEILLVSCEGALSHELSSSGSPNLHMMATWESSRTDFRDLLNEAYHPEFKPPSNWEKEVEDVMRIDDYLWVHLMALDIRNKRTNPDLAQRADYIAAGMLGKEDQVTRNDDIEAVISIWRTSMRDILLGEARKTFEVVEAGSGAFPVVGRFVGVGAKVGLALVKVIETMGENGDASDALASHTEKLSSCLEHFRRRVDAEKRDLITTHIEDLRKELERAQETVKTWKSSGRFKQLLLSSDHAGDLKATQGTVQTALERMQLLVSLKTADIVAELANTGLHAERARLLGSLGDGTSGARGSAIEEVTCLPGTRVEILDRIDEWIRGTSTYEERVLWIRGTAGLGKSTIASTVARNWGSKGSCAIFHFRRGQHELDGQFLCTLARQLGEDLVPAVRNAILGCVKENKDIAKKRPERQFKTLFVGPLGSLLNHAHPILIIVDALDECRDVSDAVQFVRLLNQYCPSLPANVKFLLTCRPEPPLVLALELGKWRSEDLDSVSHVDQDIKRFIQFACAQIREEHHLPQSWPPPTNLEAMVEMSQGLFQWARTAIAYISNGSPGDRLEELLQDPSQWTGLDKLYEQILSRAFERVEKDREREQMLAWVLGTLVVAPYPVTLEIIAFLHAEHKMFEGQDFVRFLRNDILAGLDSLLHIPKSTSEPVRLMHTSIRDLLTDRERCEDRSYAVDPLQDHRRLAAVSLEIMQRDLKQNICNLSRVPKANSEIQDAVNSNVPSGLRYCCRSWATHLVAGVSSPEANGSAASIALNRFKLFSDKKILSWLETMSLTGAASEAYMIAKQVHQWLLKWPADISDDFLNALWNDTHRFITEFFKPISSNALSIYASALLRCPVETKLWLRYQDQATAWMIVRGRERNWSAKIWTASAALKVNSVVFSPDGRSVASGSGSPWTVERGLVQLWDVQTGALLDGDFARHSHVIRSVAFSPDGKTLAWGSDDKTVQLWDAQTGAPFRGPLIGHGDWIRSVAFSPDGKLLASGSDDKTVRLWDVQTGAPLGRPLIGHGNWIRSVVFSPDGKTLASGSDDKTVRLWDAKTGAPLGGPLTGHKDSIMSVVFSPDSKTLASGSDDKTVQLWDARTGALLGDPLTGHSSRIRSVVFSPDGKTLASGSHDKTVRLWDAQTRAPLGDPLTGHSDAVMSVVFSADGKTLASGSDDKTVRLWDTQTGALLGEPLPGHSDQITSVAFSPDSKVLASGSDDKTIKLWDAQTGAPLGDPLTGHVSRITSVVFSPDGKVLASGSGDGMVQLWDVQTQAPLRGPLGRLCLSIWFTTVAFSPDGRTLASGSDDGMVHLWDAQTGAPLGDPLTGHSGWIRSVAFSPDSKLLASGSDDKTVRLWDVQTGAPLRDPLTGHSNTIMSVVFSLDGRTLASGSNDETVRLWDTQTGAQLGEPLPGHSDQIMSVVFSPDGKFLASGSDDKTIKLWDAQTGAPLGDPLTGHGDQITSLVFSPDGRVLTSVSRDGMVRFWDPLTLKSVLAHRPFDLLTC